MHKQVLKRLLEKNAADMGFTDPEVLPGNRAGGGSSAALFQQMLSQKNRAPIAPVKPSAPAAGPARKLSIPGPAMQAAYKAPMNTATDNSVTMKDVVADQAKMRAAPPMTTETE